VGARPAHIAGSVPKEGGALWLLGISLGVGLAYVAGRLGASWLHEVRAADPLILSAVSALTLAAFSLAALRGAQAEPGRVLKAD
jgi:hypothetical protein